MSVEMSHENDTSNKNEIRKKIRNDIILVGVIILAALIAGSIYMLTRKPGGYAVVSINGNVYASYSLSEDITVELQTGSDGTHRNILVIKDGKVFVSEADCRDGICVKHNPIETIGDTIVCLPNRLVIEVQKDG